MPRHNPVPQQLLGRPFAVRSALDAGATRDDLRARTPHAPFSGVRVPRGMGDSVEELCRAYVTWMRPGNAFSHTTAATLWRIPLPLHMDSRDIHVTAPWPRRAPESAGIVGHSAQLGDGVVLSVRGLPVCAPAMVWGQLAEVVSVADLVAAGEWLVTGNPFAKILPMATVDELRGEVDRLARRRGGRHRSRAIELIREGSLSRPETLVRLLLLAARLPEPLINANLDDATGSFLAMPDLCWPEFRVALEYEGDHHRGVGQFRRDLKRVEKVIDHDWTVVKASADDLFDEPVELVRRVARRLTARGWVGEPDLRRLGRFER